jgi:hypothetical protein
MRIPGDAEIKEITDCLGSAMHRDHSLQCQAPKYLGDLQIQ